MSELKNIIKKNRRENWELFKELLADLKDKSTVGVSKQIGPQERRVIGVWLRVTYDADLVYDDDEDTPCKIDLQVDYANEYGWNVPETSVEYSIHGVHDKVLQEFIWDEMGFKSVPVLGRNVKAYRL